jgi:hypothetical protein
MNKLKHFGILLAVFVLFAKSLVVPALFLNYELRKDYIIQNFCENKNRPELKCDGQCYLAKQIKAAQDEDERKATDSFLSKLYQVEHIENDSNMSLSYDYDLYFFPQSMIETAQHLFAQNFNSAIFHPPIA